MTLEPGPPVAASPATPFLAAPARPRAKTSTIVWTIIGIVVLSQLLVVVFAYLVLAYGVVPVILCAILAVVPLALVLLAITWIDRWEPEPLVAIGFALLWGAAAAVSVALAVDLGEQILSVAGGMPKESDFFTGVFRAPFVEEIAKGVGVLIIYLVAKRSFNGPIDGIVYAATVAAGFAFVENITYFGGALLNGGGANLAYVFVVRGLLSPFAHVTFTTCTGLALGFASRRRSAMGTFVLFVAGLGGAMVLHAVWNLAGFVNFWGVYFFIEVPLFAGWVAIVVVLRNREQRRTLAALSEYARAGWIAGDEAVMLATRRGRTSARRWARAKGRGAPALMKRLITDATRLAQTRERLVEAPDDRDALERERQLLQIVGYDRASLSALG